MPTDKRERQVSYLFEDDAGPSHVRMAGDRQRFYLAKELVMLQCKAEGPVRKGKCLGTDRWCNTLECNKEEQRDARKRRDGRA